MSADLPPSHPDPRDPDLDPPAGAFGLLISSFDFSPVAEDEFHDWYDTEHIPERLRIPGFLDIRRWSSIDDPKVSMTTYDLASPAVLRSPGYLAVGYENNSPWTRRVGWRCIKRLRAEAVQAWPGRALAPAYAGALLVAAANPAPGREAALEAWVEGHAAGLAPGGAGAQGGSGAVPGLNGVRAFRAWAGTHRHVVTYHLDHERLLQDPSWQARVVQPWRDQPAAADLQFTRCRRYVRGA
ncbi:MAG: hypothetical protein ACK515_00545 [bacterium]|nr:hypothetical protein [Betaproteobacteria bacterium]